MSSNNFIPWPDDLSTRYNPSIRCDALIGPCACGAWHDDHDASDWIMRTQGLPYRDAFDELCRIRKQSGKAEVSDE